MDSSANIRSWIDSDGEISRSRSVVLQLCDRPRDRILRSKSLSGSQLMRGDLGTRRGVSREFNSEACMRLTDEAVVVVRISCETFVSRIEVLAGVVSRFLRQGAEVTIVRLLAAQLSAQMLERCGDAQFDHGRGPRPFIALEKALHAHLARSAGRARRWDVGQSLKTHMGRMRARTAGVLPRELLVPQHSCVVITILAHRRQILDDLADAVDRHLGFFCERGVPA